MTIEKYCTNVQIASRKFGHQSAIKIAQRIRELSAAPNLQILVQHHVGRVHKLEGDMDGRYAMDLAGGLRLVFRPHGSNVTIEAEIVEIISIEDYH